MSIELPSERGFICILFYSATSCRLNCSYLSYHFTFDLHVLIFIFLLLLLKWSLLRTADGRSVAESSYDFSVVDSNSLHFLFKYAPEVAEELQISSELFLEKFQESDRRTWMVYTDILFAYILHTSNGLMHVSIWILGYCIFRSQTLGTNPRFQE